MRVCRGRSYLLLSHFVLRVLWKVDVNPISTLVNESIYTSINI